jgi:hypothetical protein
MRSFRGGNRGDRERLRRQKPGWQIASCQNKYYKNQAEESAPQMKPPGDDIMKACLNRFAGAGVLSKMMLAPDFAGPLRAAMRF